MKKLSKVQLKQQTLVLSVADALEEQARAEIPGMLQCWFDVEYHLFPCSCVFSSKMTKHSRPPNLNYSNGKNA